MFVVIEPVGAGDIQLLQQQNVPVARCYINRLIGIHIELEREKNAWDEGDQRQHGQKRPCVRREETMQPRRKSLYRLLKRGWRLLYRFMRKGILFILMRCSSVHKSASFALKIKCCYGDCL